LAQTGGEIAEPQPTQLTLRVRHEDKDRVAGCMLAHVLLSHGEKRIEQGIEVGAFGRSFSHCA
jgi:hypothetical protein